MIIDKYELDRMKDPEEFEFKVFKVESEYVYGGSALLGAKTIEDAREISNLYAKNDTNNEGDSWGWGSIKETNKVSDISGILKNGIYYTG